MRLPILAALLTIAATLVFVAPASAANVAPNPGFEDATCDPGPPCGWTAGPGDNVVRDTNTFHSGQASMYLAFDLSAGQTEVEAQSICISGLSPTGGDYDVSYWYLTFGPDGQGLALRVSFYDSSTCDGAPSSSPSALRFPSGSWEQSAEVHTAPPGTQSASLVFIVFCPPPPFPGCSTDFDSLIDAYVDDVVFAPQPPTAVAVNSFAARRASGGVTLNWRTSSEVETLGFHVYRQQKGKLTRLNRTLIPSVFGGSATGHRYSWLDRRATARHGVLRYRLQAVGLNGKRSWVGAATVAR